MFGKKMHSGELIQFLDHVFRRNDRIAETGEHPIPVMIWGKHGLGKTQIVKDYAKQHGWKFAYCAPAQFEEMGDLHGLPRLIDPDVNVEGDEYTVFSPPEWAPKVAGPGILLLDDMNRADDRILRGIMQLLQHYELMSWSLPARWQIVCTANPDNEDYSVTPLDAAMTTRMLHTTLLFDARSWARWATAMAVDSRCISFVLTYPEVVTGVRTTPRSLVQFFRQIEDIADFEANVDFIAALAMSSLDESTVAAFLAFVTDELANLIEVDEILNAEDFSTIAPKIEQLAGGSKGSVRVDRVAALVSRLFVRMSQKDFRPTEKQGANIVEFLLMDAIPSDLKVSLFMDINREGSEAAKAILKDKRLAKLLLRSMA